MNKKIEENIFHFISNQKLLQKGDIVLVALSGGPDSVFALHFFYKFKKKFDIQLAAIHVNHSLRNTESDEDEVFCRDLCKNLNITFDSALVDVNAYSKVYKKSIEESARILRYKKIENYAQLIDATKIVTAHNLDDNSETVLLNLFRGTGLKGASGIPIKRGNIIRPFLTTPKSDILKYLDSNNINYRIDRTNLENDYTRNFLRNEIIPLLKEKVNPNLDKSIQKFSEIVHSASETINFFTEEELRKFIKKKESGIIISNQIVFGDRKERAGEIIKLGLEKYFEKSFRFEDITKSVDLFSLQVGSKIELSNNIVAVREREYLHLDFKKDEIENKIFELHPENIVKIGKETISANFIAREDAKYSTYSNLEYIDADNLTFPLTIRRWKEGDKFQPLGLKGTKNVSDFLTDVKVSSKNRNKKLVMLNGSKIIWLIGERIDESVKIKNKTKRILKLWLK